MKTVKEYISEAIVKGKLKAYINGDFIDLGLPSGTLWARCNVGAQKPEDAGIIVAWGETKEKQTYTTETKQRIKNMTVLDSEHDVAYKYSDGKSVIPTPEQCKELIDNTNSYQAKINNVKGVKFESLKDKNKYIFIPYVSCIYGDKQHMDNGFDDLFWGIWTNTLSNSDIQIVEYCFIGRDKKFNVHMDAVHKSYGSTVRGVKNTK